MWLYTSNVGLDLQDSGTPNIGVLISRLGSSSVSQHQYFGASSTESSTLCIQRLYTRRTPGCFTKMLEDLNSEPLEVRKRYDRLSTLYRIEHNLVIIPTNRYLNHSDCRTKGPVKFFPGENHQHDLPKFLSKDSQRPEQTPSRVVWKNSGYCFGSD